MSSSESFIGASLWRTSKSYQNSHNTGSMMLIEACLCQLTRRDRVRVKKSPLLVGLKMRLTTATTTLHAVLCHGQPVLLGLGALGNRQRWYFCEFSLGKFPILGEGYLAPWNDCFLSPFTGNDYLLLQNRQNCEKLPHTPNIGEMRFGMNREWEISSSMLLSVPKPITKW